METAATAAFSEFVRLFVSREHTGRWLTLSGLGMQKLSKSYRSLERQLDKRHCRLVEHGVGLEVEDLIARRHLDECFCIVLDFPEESGTLGKAEWSKRISGDRICMFPGRDLGLYFTHDGWV